MATEFKITRLETVSKTTHLYLVVEFYVDDALTHTEDFIIGRPAEKHTYIGTVDEEGEILEPDNYLVEPLDIKQEILDVLQGFERTHRGDRLLSGKETMRVTEVKTDSSDPLGFVNRAEVQALVGQKLDIFTG